MIVLHGVSGMLIKYDKTFSLNDGCNFFFTMMNRAWKDVFCVVRGELEVRCIFRAWGVLHGVEGPGCTFTACYSSTFTFVKGQRI
jgi:hypothetical protein